MAKTKRYTTRVFDPMATLPFVTEMRVKAIPKEETKRVNQLKLLMGSYDLGNENEEKWDIFYKYDITPALIGTIQRAIGIRMCIANSFNRADFKKALKTEPLVDALTQETQLLESIAPGEANHIVHLLQNTPNEWNKNPIDINYIIRCLSTIIAAAIIACPEEVVSGLTNQELALFVSGEVTTEKTYGYQIGYYLSNKAQYPFNQYTGFPLGIEQSELNDQNMCRAILNAIQGVEFTEHCTIEDEISENDIVIKQTPFFYDMLAFSDYNYRYPGSLQQFFPNYTDLHPELIIDYGEYDSGEEGEKVKNSGVKLEADTESLDQFLQMDDGSEEFKDNIEETITSLASVTAEFLKKAVIHLLDGRTQLDDVDEEILEYIEEHSKNAVMPPETEGGKATEGAHIKTLKEELITEYNHYLDMQTAATPEQTRGCKSAVIITKNTGAVTAESIWLALEDAEYFNIYSILPTARVKMAVDRKKEEVDDTIILDMNTPIQMLLSMELMSEKNNHGIEKVFLIGEREDQELDECLPVICDYIGCSFEKMEHLLTTESADALKVIKFTDAVVETLKDLDMFASENGLLFSHTDIIKLVVSCIPEHDRLEDTAFMGKFILLEMLSFKYESAPYTKSGIRAIFDDLRQERKGGHE